MIKQFLFALFIMNASFVLAQSPVGVWKNLDDEDGKEKSHIEIYEQNGTLRGKVIKLLPAATITKCNACTGTNKGKSLVGMDILWDLKKSGKTWDSGQIMDPKNGKIYDCKIELKGTDKLNVRGYMGVSMFGRTQTWYRVK
ncbi:MAG TPA: DUF2147 domain-containing protein [Saprospiraceae bacterium]|nr:DUF2147 domain-containing protein [Saprospiraceae bacterium]HMU04933.1 DUF2147 domain-containing protein [Saprospiraceae bacterium]